MNVKKGYETIILYQEQNNAMTGHPLGVPSSISDKIQREFLLTITVYQENIFQFLEALASLGPRLSLTHRGTCCAKNISHAYPTSHPGNACPTSHAGHTYPTSHAGQAYTTSLACNVCI